MSAFDQENDLPSVVGKEEDVLSEEEDEGVEEDEKNFDEWVEDDDLEPVKSLFCNKMMPSIQALVEHDREIFGFDLQRVVADVCTDDISFIKLVNYIRNFAQQQEESPTAWMSKLKELVLSKEFLADDNNMKPVLSDDPLLYLYEDIFTTIVVQEEDEPLPAIKSIEELNSVVYSANP